MKLIILKNHLKEGLEAVGRIGNDNNLTNLPILKNILMETINNKVRLSMTNLELAITSFIPGKVIEAGGLTIPFSIFNSIINNLQSERINLESQGDNLVIKTDNYHAKIQGVKKDEFPIIPQINNQSLLEIPISIIKKSLSLIISAAQISETKPELSGILFDYQINYLKLTATDSFRLAEKTITNNKFKSEINHGFKIIIPLKTIQEIVRIFKESDDKVQIYFDPNQVLFKTENLEIISRLISGEFPDYQPIIPQSLETEIILSKEQLINALKLASSFTDRLNEIKIIFKENSKNIEVYSCNQGVGENKYLIPCKVKGPSIEIIFNWRFLLDGVKFLDSEDVFLGLNGDNKPAIIKSPNDISYFYILMPIKNN